MSILLTVLTVIFLIYLIADKEKERTKLRTKELLDANWEKIKHACLHAKLKPEVISEVKKKLYNNDEDCFPYYKWQIIKQTCINAKVRPEVVEEIKNTFKKLCKNEKINGDPYWVTDRQLEEYIVKTIESDLRSQYEGVKLKKVRELDAEIEKNLGIKFGDRSFFID
jgi:hypothetical protein